MVCNLNGGRIYKGSIAEITVPMFPRCYTGSTDELVVNFYTTTSSTSIEYSVSAGTIVLDEYNNGTVVFQVPQLGVLEDGLLRYTTTCGEDYLKEWESRWFIITPNDYTPVEYVTAENVEEYVASAMTGYLTITAANQTYALKTDIPSVTAYTTSADVVSIVTGATSAYTTSADVQSIVTASTTGYTTTGDVESMITSATSGFVTSAQVETELTDYAKLSDIPSLDSYATQQYVDNAITASTEGMVTSSTITTIWVGSEAEYDQIAVKDNHTLYIIK